MEHRNKPSKPALVFVYNAGSGLFNAATDIAHKIFAPQTYPCRLCSLTHSTFGMRDGWKRFLATLERPLEFLHADELEKLYGISGAPLPCIFKREGAQLEMLIDADSINRCLTIVELQQLIQDRLG